MAGCSWPRMTRPPAACALMEMGLRRSRRSGRHAAAGAGRFRAGRDLEGDAGGGERRGELAVVIAADEPQPGAFADGQRQPAQFRVQGGHIHGAVHDVAEQHHFLRGVTIEQFQQTLGRVFPRIDRQELPFRAMRPGVAKMQIGHREGFRVLEPDGVMCVEPEARFQFKTAAVHFLSRSTTDDTAAPSFRKDPRRAAPP